MEDDKYQWHDAKRDANLKEHKIDFERVRRFHWEIAVNVLSVRDGERRYLAIGYLEDNPRLHSVVYTWRGVKRRIISVRPASRRERDYHDQVQREIRSSDR